MKWFKNPFKTKSLPSDIEKKASTSFILDPSSYSGITINNLGFEGYSINASANSAINKIIKAIVQMKMVVTDRNDEESEPIDNKLSQLLNNPDKNQSQSEWITEYFGYYLTFGNSFILRVAPENGINIGQAQSLKVLSQNEIKIITKNTKLGLMLDRYEYKNTKHEPINEEDILHGKTFNPLNPIIGLSQLVSCGLSIDLDNGAKRWNNNLLDNGVNPSGVYTVDGELTPDQFRRIKNQMSENSGSEFAGDEKLLEGGLKYQQTGLSPKDADFSNAQLIAKREIASVYNIAPQLIGDTESQTFANYEQAVLSLHNDTAFPLLESLVEKLNNWLTPSFGENLIIKIDDSGVEALTEQKQKRWQAIDSSNELKTNEKRKEKGFDSLEDEEQGEAIIINGNTTLNDLTSGVIQESSDTPNSDDMDDDDEKSIKRISKKEYFKIQHKAMNEAEDDAIKVSHRIIASYFKRQFKEITKNLKDVTDTSGVMGAVEAVIQQTTDDLQAVYNEIYKDVSFDFAMKARFEGKEIVQDKLEIKESHLSQFAILENFKTEFSSFVDSYFVELKIGELIVAVNETTRAMIEKVVISGVQQGASVFDTTKAIQKMYGDDMELWRAERIARTETLRGMSFAQHESQLKVSPLSKQIWIDAGDNRVRPTNRKGKFNHRNADLANGKIGLNEAFKVSGQMLRFPRDTSLGATAGNVINCRCTVGYIDEEFESFFE